MKSLFIHGAVKFNRPAPWQNPLRNAVFPLFMEAGEHLGMSVCLSSFYEYDKARKRLKKAWVYDGGWKKVKHVKVGLMYYNGLNRTSRVIGEKAESYGLPMINPRELEVLCDDKLETSLQFPDIAPQTFVVNNHYEFHKVLRYIQSRKIVMKPRWGSFGRDIIFVDKHKFRGAVLKDTIIQQFIDSSHGIKALDVHGFHDLRIMIVDGKIDHAYVRMAPQGSYTANMTRGATKKYIPKDDLPQSVLNHVKLIDKRVRHCGTRVYSADFFFDQYQKPWLVELNSKPGTLYYGDNPGLRKKYYRHVFRSLSKAI